MRNGIRKFLMAVMAAGFLFGVLMLFYPLFSNLWNTYREEQLFEAYLRNLEDPSQGTGYSQEWEAARAYNAGIAPAILPDSFGLEEDAYTEDALYEACLNINGDGIMGFIKIPKIGITLPVYHSTDEEVLEKGVGHLYGSSLPVGGEGAHAVLPAHRGLPGSSLFTDLDQLEEGDQFYLYILDDVLAYEVDQILVVKPEETEALQPEEGADYVTLLTCTPYGVNTHRLLVRGHRVPYDPQTEEEQGKNPVHSFNTNYILWILIGLVLTVLLLLFIYLIVNRKKRKENAGEGEKH